MKLHRAPVRRSRARAARGTAAAAGASSPTVPTTTLSVAPDQISVSFYSQLLCVSVNHVCVHFFSVLPKFYRSLPDPTTHRCTQHQSFNHSSVQGPSGSFLVSLHPYIIQYIPSLKDFLHSIQAVSKLFATRNYGEQERTKATIFKGPDLRRRRVIPETGKIRFCSKRSK